MLSACDSKLHNPHVAPNSRDLRTSFGPLQLQLAPMSSCDEVDAGVEPFVTRSAGS